VILGGLMSMLFVSLRGSGIDQKRANLEITATKGKLAFALFEFKSQYGRFPSADEGLEALVTQPTGLEAWKGPYIDKKFLLDPWKNKFRYSVEGSQPRVVSLGADGKEGGDKEDADIDLKIMD